MIVEYPYASSIHFTVSSINRSLRIFMDTGGMSALSYTTPSLM